LKLESKKVLITGAGGFIGSHLAEELVKKGASVRALVKYNSRNDWGLLEILPQNILNSIEVVSGDVRDPFMVKSAVNGCEVIFHLASLIAIPYSYKAPCSYVGTNINGTINVLQAALDASVSKFIHTSTSEVYGTAQYTPIDENHPLQGQSPYSASKIGADKIVESYFLSFDMPVTTIRPFNTFGPRQSARAIIPTIITQALQKDNVEVGHLETARDFTYVKDTVEGFIRIAECNDTLGETINIGSGKAITIGDLAELIFWLMDKKKEIVTSKERLRPKKSEVMKLLCDNSKALNIMDWRPETDLKQGLQDTIEYLSGNIERYKSRIYNV
jgi:NAD dependent epimerase/dehydratase